MRIENMNLIPNPSDPVKPVHKIIKKDVVVSEITEPQQAQDSLQQDTGGATEHLLAFIEKKKKKQSEAKKKLAFLNYQKVGSSLYGASEQQKGVALNVKG